MVRHLRSSASVVLLVLAAVLVPVASTGWWVAGTLTDTDTYVRTVAPVATDPAVVHVAEDRLTERVMTLVDDQQVLRLATDELEQIGVPPRLAAALSVLGEPLRERVEVLVRRVVDRLLTSPEFAEAWRTSNQSAHEQLVDVLEGGTALVTTEDDASVSIRLATLSTAIIDALVDAGLPFADRIPEVEATLPIADVEQLENARTAYVALDRAGRLLPLMTVLALAGGLALARRRRRALLRTVLGALGALAVLVLALSLGRAALLEPLPADGAAAAAAVFDILVQRLRSTVRLLGLLLVVVLVVTLLSGRDPAVRARRRALHERWRRLTGAASGWAGTRPLAVAVGVVCGAALLFGGDLGVLGSLALLGVGALGVGVALRVTPS